MLREAFFSLVLAASALALLPSAPATQPACDALALTEGSLQHDAGAPGDAPDARDAPRRVSSDGYYAAYLSAVDHPDADLHDWYVYHVPEGTGTMDVNITWELPLLPIYTVELPTYVQTFTLTLYPPDGSAPRSVTPYDPTLTLVAPPAGDYLVHVSTRPVASADGCAPSGMAPLAPQQPMQLRNHGLYLGCNPVCAAG
ncbi:MAG TPA: hypothetical protein VFH78_00330 [Candidatus Thermoplasmatota archaeon]|nr:hypothetical protein [Candidatus Thermoplasmatota archaeon]